MSESKSLRERLAQLEGTSPLDEHEAFRILTDSAPEEIPDEWRFENLAFAFSEGADENQTLTFGPHSTGRREDGTVVEFPDRKAVSANHLAYWNRRAEQTNNPVIRARYLGLVWVFTLQVGADKPSHTTARGWIEAVLEVAARDAYTWELPVLRNLGIAIRLAISLKDADRFEKAKDALIAYEKRVGQDDKPGLWGHAWDALVLNKGAQLSDHDKQSLIADLEERTARLIETNPWACENAVLRLANYYRARGEIDEVLRVVSMLGQSFVKTAEKATPLQAITFLEHLEGICRHYGMDDIAASITKRVRDLGKEARAELKRHEVSVQIKKEEVDAFANSFIDGSLDDFIKQVVGRFLFKKEKVIETLRDLSKSAPLTAMIPMQLTDADGRHVATIGSITDDMEGRVIEHVSEQINFEAPFLRLVLDLGIKHYQLDASALCGLLIKSPAFGEDQTELLLLGLKHFMAGDLPSAIHVLVPRIEAAIRRFVEIAGGNILKPRKNKAGFDLCNLDELLRSPQMKGVFGEDATMYLRVLLTDPRGLNIRNLVAHGVHANLMGWSVADRLLHALLLLSMVRATKKPEPGAG